MALAFGSRIGRHQDKWALRFMPKIKVMGSSWIMPKESSVRVQVAVAHSPTDCGHGSGRYMRVRCFRC